MRIHVIRRVLIAIGTLLALAAAAPSQETNPTPTLQIEQVDPATASALGSGDRVSVRIVYSSPRPVRFRMDPYWHGAPVVFGKRSPFPAYPKGPGTAFAWITVDRAGNVDELHIAMQDADSYALLGSAIMPVQLDFSGAEGTTRARSPWAVQMQKYFDTLTGPRDDSEQKQLDRVMPRGFQDLLFIGFMAFIVALLASGALLPLYGVIRWSGGWRALAALPVVVLALKMITVVSGIHADPTSHNLLPLELGLWFGASTLFTLVVWVWRAVALRSGARS